ncbi:integrase [Vibrio breoganii]|uniref:Integrase n=1 Tax=Vibrio breoganii TaxID=553239 RepID=A0ABX1U2N2_9VIBR|nr:integrase [Vibrio breoganii]NMO72901.1 integrase [Vibrio breoganii]NMR68738.1 integrase [Vibrio breoganii]PMG03934.1 integrase [Vibrio breoganii]PML90988.1 integrase [Vibrio breoganii]
MLVAIDNNAHLEELTNDVVNNPALLHGMHVETLSQLTSYAVETEDFRVLDLLTETFTGIPMNAEHLPNWWKSDFDDDITIIKFENQKRSRELRWSDIKLENGESLTSDKHKPLLNGFKYWLIACDNPLENGGRLISSTFTMAGFNSILTLINTILINGKALKLSGSHFEKITDEFWLKTLLMIAESGESKVHELYQTHERIEQLLNNVDVSEEELKYFRAKYPHAGQDITTEDVVLDLHDRVKACCWLHKQRYYASDKRDPFGHAKPKGNNAILIKMLFEWKILSKGVKLAPFPELALKPTSSKTEYKAVLNKPKSDGVSSHELRRWLSCIKLINTNIDKTNVGIFNPVTNNVSVGAIQGLAQLRKLGRTKTLPPEFVFDLFRDSYELLAQFCPAPNGHNTNFWDSTLDLLTELMTKSTKVRSNPHRPRRDSNAFVESLHGALPDTEQRHWRQFEAIDLIPTDLKEMGVLQLEAIESTVENRHVRIRNNESMLELFTVLQGATQLLLGSIMARRQDELVQLKPYGNLVYISDSGKHSTTTTPYSEEGERWFLRFKVKKTGVKGNNLTEDRPIPLSIARFVWQLEQFNRNAIERGLAESKDLALFNLIDAQTFALRKCNGSTFNEAFNSLCDYFETALVEIETGEYRRHYVRQHQLRRFFALVFFWSKGYENMEALRWMLAHSDLEHLNNYITDNVDGAIINSAKATTIVQSVIGEKSLIDNHAELERLREILAERLTGNASSALNITTLDDALCDYEDESEFETVPHITQLQAEQEVEDEVLTLLENGSITLHPEFFTALDENGEEFKNFNLVLKINELEAA